MAKNKRKKLSGSEQILYDRAAKNAPLGQLLMFIWWSLFAPRKREKMDECITSGMHWYSAYMLAKNVKKLK